MNELKMLVRRELWEHRSFYRAPAIIAALLLLGTVFGVLKFGDRGPNTFPGGSLTIESAEMFGRSVAFFTLPLALVGAIVSFTYLLDCLYAERKDRSILFWKSMPVSDARTVLVKLFMATVVLPLIVLAIGSVTHLLASLILSVRFEAVRASMMSGMGWWFRELGLLVARVGVGALWFAPLSAYLMLASVVSKRAPFVTAFVPPLVVVMLEHYAFGTHRVGTAFLERLTLGAGRRSWSWSPDMASDPAFHLLTDPALWIGLAVAAALLWITIRMRRYRDDT